MPFKTTEKPIPRDPSNYELVVRVFSRCLNMSVFGVILATRYIPQMIFNAVMVLATFGAVFFIQSSSKSPDKKPEKKESSRLSNTIRAAQNSVLMLMCMSLMCITFYILCTSFWYNVVNGTAITSLFFAMFAGLCILLVILSIWFRNLMNSILPYMNILIVLFFIVMLVLQQNIVPASTIYVPVSAVTSISTLFLILPGFATVSHQFTAFSKANKKRNDMLCMIIGVVLSGVFYICLGNLTYYFEGILNLLLHFISENSGTPRLISYIGYSSWYGMSLRALVSLFCLVNFLANYDDLRKRLFQRDKDQPGIAYGTVVFSLAYYIVMFALAYFNYVNFQTIALFIPLHILYSTAFYLYPLAEALSKKVGWVYAIPLMMLLILSLIGLLYLFFGNVTLSQLVFFIPSQYLRMMQTG